MAYAYTFQFTPGDVLLERKTNQPVIIVSALTPEFQSGIIGNGPSEAEKYVVVDTNRANRRVLVATDLIATS